MFLERHLLSRIAPIAILAAGVAASLSGGPALAAPVRLAVPFSIDRVLTPSTMALEVEAQDLGGQGLESLKLAPLGPLQTFSTLLGHLAAGEAAAAAALLRPQAFQGAGDALNYAQNMSEAFKDALPALKLQRRYDLGAETWVTWEINLAGQPVRRSFRFAENGGRWLWADELQTTPLRTVQTILTASEQLTATGNSQTQAVEGMGFQHRGVVPGSKALWLFNGFACTWNAFGPTPPPDHPVTKFYSHAAKALAAGDVASLAGFYTPFSGQRFHEAVDKMADPEKIAYFDGIRQQGRQVTFVLEASPVFIVFYETAGRGMLYDVLFAENGDLAKIKLTSFMVESFIDEILKDQGVFHDPVIRPLAGRPQDPAKVAATALPGPPPSVLPSALPSTASLAQPAPSVPVSNPAAAGPVASRFPPWAWLLALLVLLGLFLVFRFLRQRS